MTLNGNIIVEEKFKNSLYKTRLTNQNENIDHANLIHNCSNKNCIELWHRSLGHRNYQSIKNTISKQLANGIKTDKCKHDTICETCIWVKNQLPMSKLPIRNRPNTKKKKRNTDILQLIHSYVCGPKKTSTICILSLSSMAFRDSASFT